MSNTITNFVQKTKNSVKTFTYWLMSENDIQQSKQIITSDSSKSNRKKHSSSKQLSRGKPPQVKVMTKKDWEDRVRPKPSKEIEPSQIEKENGNREILGSNLSEEKINPSVVQRTVQEIQEKAANPANSLKLQVEELPKSMGTSEPTSVAQAIKVNGAEKIDPRFQLNTHSNNDVLSSKLLQAIEELRLQNQRLQTENRAIIKKLTEVAGEVKKDQASVREKLENIEKEGEIAAKDRLEMRKEIEEIRSTRTHDWREAVEKLMQENAEVSSNLAAVEGKIEILQQTEQKDPQVAKDHYHAEIMESYSELRQEIRTRHDEQVSLLQKNLLFSQEELRLLKQLVERSSSLVARPSTQRFFQQAPAPAPVQTSVEVPTAPAFS